MALLSLPRQPREGLLLFLSVKLLRGFVICCCCFCTREDSCKTFLSRDKALYTKDIVLSSISIWRDCMCIYSEQKPAGDGICHVPWALLLLFVSQPVLCRPMQNRNAFLGQRTITCKRKHAGVSTAPSVYGSSCQHPYVPMCSKLEVFTTRRVQHRMARCVHSQTEVSIHRPMCPNAAPNGPIS